MPNEHTHEFFSNIIFKDPYTEANQFFDAGQKIFSLYLHRLLPPHDPISAICYAIYKKDFKIILVYLLHIMLDLIQTSLLVTITLLFILIFIVFFSI